MTTTNMTTTSASVHVLVLNPNSSHDMTHGVEEAIRGLHLPASIAVSYYTGPKDSPASINDDADLAASTTAVLADLARDPSPLHGVDAVLVACFSVHPLVARLRGGPAPSPLVGDRVLVQGLFEASLLTSLSLLPPAYDNNSSSSNAPHTWGIVTTGKFWEAHLAEGVNAFLGVDRTPSSFAGVFSTGLNAGDFHGGVAPEVIRAKLKDATLRLLATGRVACVVMGCAGMAGLEEIIRSAARDLYGTDRGNRVFIVDGTKAGVGLLDQSVRNMRAFGE